MSNSREKLAEAKMNLEKLVANSKELKILEKQTKDEVAKLIWTTEVQKIDDVADMIEKVLPEAQVKTREAFKYTENIK